MPVPTKKKKRSPTAAAFGLASNMISPRNAATFLADATFGENDPEMPLPPVKTLDELVKREG